MELINDPEQLEEIIDVLDFEDMPPEEEEPLDSGLRQSLISELRTLLDSAIATQVEAIPTPMRRMNRFQYNNSVQDLFELDVEVFTLPERMLREHCLLYTSDAADE